MTSLKDAALEYAKRGWPVFPVKIDKTPCTSNGVMDATTDPVLIEEMWTRWPNANIALNVGETDMMVLDLDPGHSMEELEKNVGPIPKTKLVAITPRGGKHIFLRISKDEKVVASASKLAPHVDVRSFNSYVLLAPSKTKDGSYSWESEGKPAFRTEELLRLSNSGREKHEDRDTWIIEPDLQENIDAATKWLREEARVAIEGQGGDSMAFATAAHMKSFGISEVMALDLMLEHWNPRCSPPWSADEIEHLERKVENGYSYNKSPPGNITTAYKTAATLARFKPVVTQLAHGVEVNAGRFRFVEEAGLKTISPPSWLIEGFLPAGSYAMIFGEPGTFKTFLALDIALSIAAGEGFGVDAPWQRVATTGPVLFAAGEGRSDITRRVQAWQKRHNYGEETGNFVLADPVPLVSEQYQPFIDGALEVKPDGYKLCILDTVGRAMAGLNENSQEHASAFSNLVENLQYSLGCAVLVLHHTGLTEKHRSRGSSVFGADADTIVRLDRQSKAKIVSLTMTKQKDAQEWERKKYIRMETVIVSLDPMIDSLVAVTGQAIGDKEDADETAAVANVDDVAEEVSDAIVEHLSLHQETVFVDLSLAQAVAGAGGVKEDSIRRKYLKIIRADKEKRASRLYDKDARQGKGAWQWVDED